GREHAADRTADATAATGHQRNALPSGEVVHGERLAALDHHHGRVGDAELLLAECDVERVDAVGVDHALDVAFGVQVEVGAVDREPHVGDTVVVGGNVQRVDRAGGFVQVGPCRVHGLGALEVVPAARLGERV